MDERIKPYLIASEPYYRPAGREVELFEAAYARRMPIILKGHRLRQDAFYRVHGVAPAQTADRDCL